MAVEIRREWVGPAAWLDWGDGVQTGTQTHVTTIRDVRDTPLGPVDFGCVIFGAQRRVERQSPGGRP